MLEVRIITGARAGQADRFEKDTIVVGRLGTADLRFAPEQDLDVSGRHAEIRLINGVYTVHDVGSTNGTYVNGRRVEGSATLQEGDKVQFGAHGPEVEIRVLPAAKLTPTRSHKAKQLPTNTEVRIAAAVEKHTAGLKRMMVAALLFIVAGAGVAYYFVRRDAVAKTAALNRLLAQNDSVAAILQGGGRDTALLRRIVQMDLPTIHKQNSPAVALLVSEIGGRSFAGSGFAIAEDGTLLTNRHNVRDENGITATRIAVKFSNTREWLPAHIVKLSDVGGEDLALIKLDRGGPFPVVQGVDSTQTDATEGTSVVTIGFPLGYDTPMEGDGNDFMAKSTLNPGTVGKRTSTVLQIDSYAAHGSSGSPVFNTRGLVVGVVYGGAPEGGGRIVYAVPPDRIAAFIPQEYRTVIKGR
jgi:S1-C subfamily serine protease